MLDMALKGIFYELCLRAGVFNEYASENKGQAKSGQDQQTDDLRGRKPKHLSAVGVPAEKFQEKPTEAVKKQVPTQQAAFPPPQQPPQEEKKQQVKGGL